MTLRISFQANHITASRVCRSVSVAVILGAAALTAGSAHAADPLINETFEYYLMPGHTDDLYLGVYDGSAATDANVTTMKKGEQKGGAGSILDNWLKWKFKIVKRKPLTYAIINSRTNQLLSTSHLDYKSVKQIYQPKNFTSYFKKTESNLQKWRLEPDRDTGLLRIKNVGEKMYLDVIGQLSTPHAVVGMWPYEGGQQQQWRFVELPPSRVGDARHNITRQSNWVYLCGPGATSCKVWTTEEYSMGNGLAEKMSNTLKRDLTTSLTIGAKATAGVEGKAFKAGGETSWSVKVEAALSKAETRAKDKTFNESKKASYGTACDYPGHTKLHRWVWETILKVELGNNVHYVTNKSCKVACWESDGKEPPWVLGEKPSSCVAE